MAGIAGRLIGLQVNGAFVSCEVSCDFNFQVDMMPASAVDSEGWKEFIAGIRSWSVNVNGHLLAEAVGADFKTIMNAVFLRQQVLLTIGTRPSATTQLTLTGTALPATGGFTGPNKGASTWTVNFQGTGEIVASFEDFEIIIMAMPVNADYPLVVDEDIT